MVIQDPNNYWEQLERLEKLIRASELKAGVVFSFHSLILGIFVDRIKTLSYLFEEGIIPKIGIICWMFFVLLSVFYCFKCFKPQIERGYEKNVFFFSDAVYKFGSIEEYTQYLIEICGSQQKLYEQLGQQIHAESKIIDGKFKCVHSSIKYFAISFVFAVLVIIYWIFTLF
ncbi:MULTISPECIES: Pycsar system effector family protein [Mangrovimonas]|uniref:Pycsar system effector family protein n=1 Tax=Mangrovimonas TaxID=1211036 RepID=UPI0006B5027B|nr:MULTISPECIES: Pycsar system effector family protein [Mangrovimonas]OMP30754.1 hypothetical protein BKM32_10990 [Mangrovimonas sp. DI 80]